MELYKIKITNKKLNCTITTKYEPVLYIKIGDYEEKLSTVMRMLKDLHTCIDENSSTFLGDDKFTNILIKRKIVKKIENGDIICININKCQELYWDLFSVFW